MESPLQPSDTETQFDIRVALVGYVSVGKSTVLNALLGDTFSEVARQRTTAGINLFRIAQPTVSANAGDSATEPNLNPESIRSTNDSNLQAAPTVLQEISRDNRQLRSTHTVQEKTFDVRVPHPLCPMRPDSRLVLIDIPGMNEAESSKKYRDYVETNWKTFDCVVVVMDATQGVNTEEQVNLLKFVERNNRTSKDLPTIVLGNKMDDLDDQDTQHLVEETLSKTIEIFGDVHSGIVDDADGVIDADVSACQTAFVPISAKNAFAYRKAGGLSLGKLKDPQHKDLINKIGSDEFGRKWSKMKQQNKIIAVFDILQDPVELDERLEGSNFNVFLQTLSKFVGGDARQRDILASKIRVELKALREGNTPPGDKAISESIFEVYKKCQLIGGIDTDGLQETFWKIYQKCEDSAFDDLEVHKGPGILNGPFVELEKYCEMASVLEWTEESARAIDAMKQLVRRQLSFLSIQLDVWKFEKYCIVAGGETHTIPNNYRCEACKVRTHCDRVCEDFSTRSGGYFVCGQKDGVRWKTGWEAMHILLSPHDWMVVLESLSLVWNERRFIEDFGSTKVKLNRALTKFVAIFSSTPEINLEGSRSNHDDHINRICLHAYRDELRKNGADSAILASLIKMPESLANPQHWGALAWKYVQFCNGQNSEPAKKRSRFE